MSMRAINWVWSLEKLGVSETLVMLALADRADDDGIAWPAQGDLARRARQTDRNVRRVLGRLERLGLLTVERRSSRHGRRSNRYHLNVGARVCESLESRQEDRLSGCGNERPASPVGTRAEQGGSAWVAATGQIVRLRKRTDCPVAQPDTGVLRQPDTDVRLHIGRTTSKNHQTRPDRGEDVPARTGSGPVGDGTCGGRARPVAGVSDAVPAAAAAGGVSAASESGAGRGPSGGTGSRPGPGSFSKASGAVGRGLNDAKVLGGARLSESLSAVLAGCLPEWMRVMDRRGAVVVAGLLEERLRAGWRPEQIRRLLEGPPPERVRRMSKLVAWRLVENVDPGLAPARLAAAGGRGVSEEARHERARRRSEVLAGTARPEPEEAGGGVWARVREAVPGESPLVQAAVVVEARRAGGLAGVDVAGVVERVRERAGRRVGVSPGGPGRG